MTNVRSRGVASVGLQPDGSVAWVLGMNGSIYTYDVDSTGQFTAGASTDDSSVMALGANTSLKSRSQQLASYVSAPISHPSLTTKSFYPRLSVSPDGSFLASGSSSGKALVWDTNSIFKGQKTDARARWLEEDNVDQGLLRHGNVSEMESLAVVLSGHAAEVSCVDWGYDTVSASFLAVSKSKG